MHDVMKKGQVVLTIAYPEPIGDATVSRERSHGSHHGRHLSCTSDEMHSLFFPASFFRGFMIL
jgi:hypothetical protein